MRPTHRPAARVPSAAAVALALGAGTTAAPAAATTAPPTFTATVSAEHLAASDAWTDVLAAQPGERLRLLISYANTSTVVEHNALVSIKLPRAAILAGAVTLTNAMHPGGVRVPGNQLTHRGINVGNYGPGADGYLTAYIRMPAPEHLRCGTTPLTVSLEERVGAAHHGATLYLHAHHDCPVNMMTAVAPPTR